VTTIDEFCAFPAVEKRKLAKRILFCFLTGNEDMHLKNFSLINRKAKVELSPAYDLLNTSIVLRNPREECALPIRGKKSNLTRNDLISYFCRDRCQLSDNEVKKLLDDLESSTTAWPEVIQRSYLSVEMKEHYSTLFEKRCRRLFTA
jgi:serine/threonine-protein kinase HipA